MSLLAAIRGRKAHGLKALPYILLLTFYVAGTANFEWLHEFLHSHDHLVSHSEVQEKDPCHRAIYHHEAEKGCGHDSHIVVTEKCELCDSIFHSDQILLSKPESRFLQFSSLDFVLCSPEPVSIGLSILSSRAPPAV
jgi:hypothetical protein